MSYQQGGQGCNPQGGGGGGGYPQQGYNTHPYGSPHPAGGYGQYQSSPAPQQQQQQQQQQYGMGPPAHHHQQQQPHPAPPSTLSQPTDSGAFEGGKYQINHRDTNTMLTVHLQPGAAVKTKPGAMIEMSPTVKLEGKIKFSMRKMFTGGDMAESSLTGPGMVSLAPTLFGDISTIHINPHESWNVGKDAFLACTMGVTKETKSQGVGKALFSGEDLFVYRIGGHGVLWLSSFGAIAKRELGQGEQHIVDNGHLVAWNCNYSIEKAGGGTFGSMKTGEGYVCRFTGPGAVYLQTRNLEDFKEWVAAQAPSSG